MTPPDRYDTSTLAEDQFEPGSDGTVMKNLLNITSREEMEIIETEHLWRAQTQLLGEIEPDQKLTARELRAMHRLWLGPIYPWAGEYRQVNISKSGFTFAMAHTIPSSMTTFEREQLGRHTPCQFASQDEIAHSLAEVHTELMLIHPFREGNGRIGRLLATLMGLQAGLPPLDFSDLAGESREEYFGAVRAGLDRDYRPMTKLFADVIRRSS